MCSTAPFSRLGSAAQLTCVTYVLYNVSASTPITCHCLAKAKTNKQKQNKNQKHPSTGQKNNKAQPKTDK